MSIKRLLFLCLFLAVLSSFAGRALAQSVPQQFVVTYVEFKPADPQAGAQMLEELAANAEHSPGVVNFDVLQQMDARNSFALRDLDHGAGVPGVSELVGSPCHSVATEASDGDPAR